MAGKLVHPLIRSILERYRTIWALNHMKWLAQWDLNTYMPEDGSKARAEALSKVEILSQSLFLETSFVHAITDAAMHEKEFNDHERAVIRLLKRTLNFYQKLPPSFIESFTKVTSEAHLVWKRAKETSNFSLFAPFLEKIVDLSRKKAEYLGYKVHPYDALLDEYDEGLTTADVVAYFATIKDALQHMVRRIITSQNYREEHDLEHEVYALDEMKKLAQKILEIVHYNLNNLRLDTSPHPFSTGIGEGDTRITTRYEGKDFARSLTAVIHEYGHALYETQAHDELAYTPLAGGSSLIVHESQSRLWENIIGRSREFLEMLHPHIKALGKNFERYTIDDIYRYLNLVKPGVIRVDADEITYHFHVMIRFEIEKSLIEGTLAVKDVPKVWNERYREYLGVVPENDAQGALQDIHWSQGSIGYFPTYSLGTALSAIIARRIEYDLGPIASLVQDKDDLRKIQDWLHHHIHQHGSTYTFADVAQKIAKTQFTSAPLLQYLEHKYAALY